SLRFLPCSFLFPYTTLFRSASVSYIIVIILLFITSVSLFVLDNTFLFSLFVLFNETKTTKINVSNILLINNIFFFIFTTFYNVYLIIIHIIIKYYKILCTLSRYKI